MSQTTVDLQFLSKQVQTLIEEAPLLRKEVADVRTLTLQTFEFSRRAERRQADLRCDLEITIKMEFGGGLANLQTAIESSLTRIEGNISWLSDRSTLETRQ